MGEERGVVVGGEKNSNEWRKTCFDIYKYVLGRENGDLHRGTELNKSKNVDDMVVLLYGQVFR